MQFRCPECKTVIICSSCNDNICPVCGCDLSQALVEYSENVEKEYENE